jgi:meso-butanediol dehydrogenase/(S,S)-butanediol dehydrogenase/diacetyl reductase
MSTQLTDRVAIVTGGAQSIGAAIADRLAASGATVVVGDLNETAAHESHHLDVTSEDSIVNVIEDVAAAHGRIDIVVNNAGIMFEKHLAEQDRESWELMLAVNLTGPMLMSRHAAPHLAVNGVGSIVNISSIEGTCGNPEHVAYSATKSGVDGLTRAAAIDLGPEGIRCNAIAPGWIDTPLNATYVDSHPDRELVIDELAKLHPVGRVGNTADVGDVAVWLASDESRFVTGQVITVDGGRTLRPTLPPVMGR